METKYCPVCNQDLPLTAFALDGKKLDSNGNPYRRRVCNQCRAKLRKEKKREKKFNKALEKGTESQESKVCVVCGEEKPITKFAKEGRINKDGTIQRRKYCNPCRSKIRKGEINKESVNILRQQEKLKKDIERQQAELERTIEKEQEAIKHETEVERDAEKGKLISALVELSRTDLNRLDEITEDEFVSKTNSEHILLEQDYDFEELKNEAMAVVLDMGFHMDS